MECNFTRLSNLTIGSGRIPTLGIREAVLLILFYFRQKALKALNDRMKIQDTTSDAWPEMDEIQQTPLLPPTHQIENSSVILDMNNSNDLSTLTKEDLNQQ